MFQPNRERCFLVAEIGINHNGDVELAKKLITVAKETGFDCVKFQKRSIDVVYTKTELDAPRESPWGKTNREQKMGLEFNKSDYVQIDKFCQKISMPWTASPWDSGSLDFLMDFNLPYIKIASASLTDVGLLEYAARKEKPIWLSTGMSHPKMISDAVRVITEAGGFVGMLYHCTSTYPAKCEEINLRGITTLKQMFPSIPIGYSGHEPGVPQSVMAAVLGAESVERHITLSKSMYGSDQAASLDPEGARRLVRDIRLWEKSRGNGCIQIYDSELPIIEKLRRVDTLTKGVENG